MKEADDLELFRLCAELEQISRNLPISDPKRETLKKAGLALHIVFDNNLRPALDELYDSFREPRTLTQAEREHLLSLGIDPDAT